MYLEFFVFDGDGQASDLWDALVWKVNSKIDWASRTVRCSNNTLTLNGVTTSLLFKYAISDDDKLYVVNLSKLEESGIPLEAQRILKPYSKILNSELANSPPANRVNKHHIETADAKPVAIPTKKMSPRELVEAERQAKEPLDKQFIRPSMSP